MNTTLAVTKCEYNTYLPKPWIRKDILIESNGSCNNWIHCVCVTYKQLNAFLHTNTKTENK